MERSEHEEQGTDTFWNYRKAVGWEPEAVDTTLRHYKGYIKYCSVFQWNFNANI